MLDIELYLGRRRALLCREHGINYREIVWYQNWPRRRETRANKRKLELARILWPQPSGSDATHQDSSGSADSHQDPRGSESHGSYEDSRQDPSGRHGSHDERSRSGSTPGQSEGDSTHERSSDPSSSEFLSCLASDSSDGWRLANSHGTNAFIKLLNDDRVIARRYATHVNVYVVGCQTCDESEEPLFQVEHEVFWAATEHSSWSGRRHMGKFIRRMTASQLLEQFAPDP